MYNNPAPSRHTHPKKKDLPPKANPIYFQKYTRVSLWNNPVFDYHRQCMGGLQYKVCKYKLNLLEQGLQVRQMHFGEHREHHQYNIATVGPSKNIVKPAE